MQVVARRVPLCKIGGRWVNKHKQAVDVPPTLRLHELMIGGMTPDEGLKQMWREGTLPR